MKLILTVFVAAVLSVLTLSCSDAGAYESGLTENTVEKDSAEASAVDEDNKGIDSKVESEEISPDESPVAYLDLCYATSINMPEDNYGPENVFDGDSTTYWATMPGAAPDDGLYFSFQDAINIETITVETLPGSDDFEEIERIQFYINGVEGSRYISPGSSLYIGRQELVKSVFVKINRTESMEYGEQGICYRRDVPVAISEIMITVLDDRRNEIPLQIIPIASAKGSVEASSSLEPVEAYSPDFLFDSRPAFGWADGNVNSSGEGEYLTFNFDDQVRIEKLLIWNGYHRSGTHYQHNERASLISFGLEGETPVEYLLEDFMEPQLYTLEAPLEGDTFKMTFLEVFPGEVYQDLVVSELRFFDGEEWFVIDTDGDEARKQSILDWAENCDAAAIIDKQISADSSGANHYNTQSLVIRSNGSFVIWKLDERRESEERMYADGNWQILDDNTIRIFGRVHRLASYEQDGYDPYAGSWSDQQERLDRMTVFSDTLSFNRHWISSSRGMFDDFSF